MIPRSDEPDGDVPRSSDLALGLARTTWAWIAGAVVLLGFVGFLLWGANRPDDPELSADDASELTPSTPADGLQFAETARLVGESCLRLLAADTTEERASGLRHRESELERVDGMLFVNEAPQLGGGNFTMSEVVAPLEVGFYGADGARLGGHVMEPCPGSIADCPLFPAPAGWQFAVETKPARLPDGDLGAECEP